MIFSNSISVLPVDLEAVFVAEQREHSDNNAVGESSLEAKSDDLASLVQSEPGQSKSSNKFINKNIYQKQEFLNESISFEQNVICANDFIFDKKYLSITEKREWNTKQLANLLISQINLSKKWNLKWFRQSIGYFCHFYRCNNANCQFIIKVEFDSILNIAFCKTNKTEHNCIPKFAI